MGLIPLKTYMVTETDWAGFYRRVLAEKPVMGPKERPDQPGFFLFDRLERFEDFRPDYSTTTIPPKKAFFPPEERLFTFTLDDPPRLDMCLQDDPFILMGVHPCDLAALEALDRAYAHSPAEIRWGNNRKRGLIIGLDCQPDEYCFCSSTGDSEARGPCDLFMTPIEDGYLLEVHTKKGAAMVEGEAFAQANPEAGEQAEAWRLRKKTNIANRLDADPAGIARVLEKCGHAGIWREIAERCYSCGSCNTTCPTCFCFLMSDELDLSLREGFRRRTWDSCQLLDFARVAGGHNFRGQRWERVKHRWHRKFLYLYRQFGRPYCTGCGRCSRACTADINIVDVTNRILAETGHGGVQ